MKTKLSIQDFLQIEEKQNLYNQCIEGFYYWNYIRFNVYDIFETGGKRKGNVKKKNPISLIGDYFKNSPTKKYANTDILILNHPRRILVEGRYVCPYTEFISDYFPNTVMLERYYEGKHLKPAKTDRLIYNDRYTVNSYIYAFLCRRFKGDYYRNVCGRIRKTIAASLGEYISEDDITNISQGATKKFFEWKYLRKHYSSLLNILKPKVVINVVHYSMYCMVMTELSKEYGIPVIEMQHGEISESHIAYNYQTDKDIKQFPNYILLFGEYWKENIKYPISKNSLISVGFQHFINNRKIQRRQNSLTNILVISQGLISQKMCDSVCEIAKELSDQEYHIIYKLHPVEYNDWKTIYPGLLDTRIEVVDQYDVSIYDCFARSDLIIGIMSTAVYEGLGSGIPVIIYTGTGEEYYYPKQLIDMGYAMEASNTAEILDIIIKRKYRRNSLDSEYFFKDNAENNVIETITNYI